MTLGFSVTRMFADDKTNTEGLHPLILAERAAGISATEAARRLHISIRHYWRYRQSRMVPDKIWLAIELGALDKFREIEKYKELLNTWQLKHIGNFLSDSSPLDASSSSSSTESLPPELPKTDTEKSSASD